ncbi:hypothetical protein PVK06_019545 [Gossypium arboreum]|uniref:Uncharacterized protein n=1 Tax=Gossypium arboreum TaxID=29729 RepID=A0ABR0PK09_GOSAR|nr:hypothetical protein PVK06_019545 [Gossypium arboreum]
MLLLIVGESDFEDDMLLLNAGESDFEGVEADGEGDVERVQADGEGDVEGGEANGEDVVEKVQAVGQGDVEGVKADREGVTATQFEADEYDGRKMSLGPTIGEDNDGMDNVAIAVSGEEEDGNEDEVYDSDEYGNLVRSDKDEEHGDGERRTSNYSPVAKCLQIKNFQKEHHFLASFKNKMVTAAMIAQHFEAIIKDHPKIFLSEIQRRCASEIYVNVSIDCCYRAKKIVKEKMIGKSKEEFGWL